MFFEKVLFSAHFDAHRDRIPAAEAQCRDAFLAAGAFELVDEGDEDAGTRSTDWVSECDAAATEVEFVFGNAQLLDIAQKLSSEGFVDFVHINIVDRPSGFVECALDAFDRGFKDILGIYS